MLIFHEGLPGSGKTYEAALNRIIPALLKGRQVFTNVEGINFEKFSEITKISLEKLQGKKVSEANITRSEINTQSKIVYTGLLHQLTDEQIKDIHLHVADDSLVVIDELQDFFPVGTRALSEGITKFVTQHRHRGIDIIVMGQDNRDCHNLWKRRIDQLIHFVKRDAIGRPNDYTWITYKQNQGKFKKLRAGKGTYDKNYFGLYASHVATADNVETYSDDRSNIFKSSTFRITIPVFILILFYAIYYLFTFFGSDSQLVDTEFNKSHKVTKPAVSAKAENIVIENVDKEEQSPQEIALIDTYSEKNYITGLANQYRPRIKGIIENSEKIVAVIEFLDSSFHSHEELNLKQLQDLGWDYERKSYGIRFSNGVNEFVATSWPLDIYGRVSQHTNSLLR